MWSVDAQISSFALFSTGQEIQLYKECPTNTLKSRVIGILILYLHQGYYDTG